ncbi:hypothetical protein A3L04_08750 [Thermococcus chitonophagus]|uniref:EamA domain-containing protein n=1 Tax=Thermococcus chitonophagus TaxID=54262 RepID=A0A2Z2N5P4_9EURY|nr:EamA family transporter [Thermococcus chitonophagus]ASJ17151.1 hypothetical protein A3L04_08750 [Thermococcus chitonophagus]
MNYIAYALLSAFFASLVPIFGKLGLKTTSPELASAVRAIVMATFLTMLVITKGELKEINGKEFAFILLSGIAGALSWLFYFKAIKLGKVSIVAPIDRLSVALAVILAWLILGENITLKTALGVFLIVAGTLLLL